jgi:hypothetical protein
VQWIETLQALGEISTVEVLEAPFEVTHHAASTGVQRGVARVLLGVTDYFQIVVCSKIANVGVFNALPL